MEVWRARCWSAGRRAGGVAPDEPVVDASKKVPTMEIRNKRSTADPASWRQRMLGDDLQRSFELTRMALEQQNESIARVSRSLNELVEVLDKAILTFGKAAPTDGAS